MKLHCFATTIALCLVINLFGQNNLNIELRATLEWPNNTLAGVWGYVAPDAREYALVGASSGMIIVEVTNPDQPVEIKKIPGGQSLWRETKTYHNFAYVTSESANNGIQIVDLTNLPNPNLPFKNFNGSGAGQLTDAHTVQVDTSKGFLYFHGTNNYYTYIFDLKPDPWNPTYVGKYQGLGYVHDGYVDNDTLYAAHIYEGQVAVVDMADKANPMVLGGIETPARFTHSAWPSGDRQHLFVTDERTPSYLVSYDISDVSDPIELGRLALFDNGTRSLVHNAYWHNGYIVASWYTDGVAIVDAHRPENLVPVGHYDTWEGSGGEPFGRGCWDVCPYLPSGTILATNIPNSTNTAMPGKLFLFTPNYQRAAYIEGRVLDACTGEGLLGVEMTINVDNPLLKGKTDAEGRIKCGHYASGAFTLYFSKPGYATHSLSVTLVQGEVTTFEVTMEAEGYMSAKGQILDRWGNPVPDYTVWMCQPDDRVPLKTDANGYFGSDCVPKASYVFASGIWGEHLKENGPFEGNTENIALVWAKGYYDNFAYPHPWSVNQANATDWQRSKPIGQQYQGSTTAPSSDSPWDQDSMCFVTGNGGADAVSDGLSGSTALTSPNIFLQDFVSPILSFDVWFNKKQIVDSVTIPQTFALFNLFRPSEIFSGAWAHFDSIIVMDSVWRERIAVPIYEGYSRIQFEVRNPYPQWQIIEAGIDRFRVTDKTVLAKEQHLEVIDQIVPNPCMNNCQVTLLPHDYGGCFATVHNTLGQVVWQQPLADNALQVALPGNLGAGMYFFGIRNQQGVVLDRRCFVRS